MSKNERKNRKKLMNLELRNYLLKLLYLNLNCFKISYTAVRGGFSEKLLDKSREQIEKLLSNGVENLEFVFLTSTPGKKIKINMIVCYRPIISSLLNESSIYAELNEQYMLFDKIKISIIKTSADVDVALSGMCLRSDYDNFTIINYSRFFKDYSGSFIDFLAGSFDEGKNQAISELNVWSHISGNCTSIFDAGSLLYILKLFLQESNMEISEKNLKYYAAMPFDGPNPIIIFIQNKFYYQTRLLNLKLIFTRYQLDLLRLLSNVRCYDKILDDNDGGS